MRVASGDAGLRFDKAGNSVKSSAMGSDFIDIEIDQTINQQEHPFL
jgi:hypothetical protein